ncbi:PfkB family carbohydrate kinase [Planctomycetota bacterium]
MNTEQINQILDKIKNVKVAVYGDFCLDAYWILDPKGGELSVETGLQSEGVGKHYYTLGGASNVVANLAALEPAAIKTIGVAGDDIFARELIRQFKTIGVNTDAMIIQKENFDTPTFAKRYLEDQEQPRIDFGFFNKRTKQTDEAIIKGLRDALETCDAMIFNQQVPGSLENLEFIEQANKLFDEFDDRIVLLDSRHYGDKFRNIYRKTNDIEATWLNGIEAGLSDVITLDDVKSHAQNLYRQSNKPVFITRGPRGILTVDSSGLHEVPGIQILKKIDTVGAGDTTVSAIALCLGAGLEPDQAAIFANFAAAVTVQKLFQTGTASGAEIIEVSKDADYIYNPELAEDIRHACYVQGAEIELCHGSRDIEIGNIKHAVFDHDGTISTLRQGWETIMEPVMIKSILGSEYETADETLYHKVRNRVIDFIDKSTGIQTIVQMEGLVEMVKEFGIVPDEKILDNFGYKEIYNDALMGMVNQRIEKFKTGQLDLNDYTVKGAIAFLDELKNRGVKMYLASGTDKQDVINEAKVLGYAELFDGGIYGAVGDISKYSKKMVIENIMSENKLQGSELIVFGDGPVEIRECRKRNGIAVGIASDEIRRHGLNKEKRSRLIKAGAQVLIPDFSQLNELIKLLFGK